MGGGVVIFLYTIIFIIFFTTVEINDDYRYTGSTVYYVWNMFGVESRFWRAEEAQSAGLINRHACSELFFGLRIDFWTKYIHYWTF